jgi:peptidyl-prolyl cis-trans isomerase SurA
MRISRALASAALVVVVANGARADIIDRVVAVVDGHLITMSDVRTINALHLLDPSSPASPVEAGRDPIVEHLIDRILVLEEVDRYAPAPPDDTAIDGRIGVIEQATGSQALVEERLHELGLSSAWLRQWATDSLRIRAYVDQRFGSVVQATDEELEAYFRGHQSDFAGKDVNDATVQSTARAAIVAERRRAVLTEWITGLRRRADVMRPEAK